MKIRFLAVLVAAGTIAAAPVVLAEDEPETTEETQSVTASQLAASAGLRAVRDKKTGKFRAPNANELQEMEEAEAANSAARGASTAATAEPVVVHHASGMLSAQLGPEHMMSLGGTQHADGSIEKSHSDNAESADSSEKTVVLETLPTE